MQVDLYDPKDLTPYINNPRHNEAAIPAVMASLKEFGFRQPIVVDDQFVIVVGHTRWQAALKLGLEAVPVHVATDLTPQQIAAYRLADNKVGEIADWDEDALMAELAKLMDSKIDMSSFGFSAEDMKALGADFKAPEDKRWLEDFDVLPKPKPKWILISAPEDQCAAIISTLNEMKNPALKFEYSGDKPNG